MLYREIIAVFSEIHTKHINTLCGRNVELLNVKLVVHIVTTGLSTHASLQISQFYFRRKTTQNTHTDSLRILFCTSASMYGGNNCRSDVPVLG